MRGAESLVAMRLSGLKPAIVWMVDVTDPKPSPMDLRFPQADHLYVGPTEKPALLDLRCVVGLTVLLSSYSEDRLVALLEACRAAGASRVMAMRIDPATLAVGLCIDTVEVARG